MTRLAVLLFLTIIALLINSAVASKIDTKLQASLDTHPEGQFNVVISFEDSISILKRFQTRSFSSRGEKLTFLQTQLDIHRFSTQSRVLNFLSNYKSQLNFSSLWINNKIYLKDATPELIFELATFQEITDIREENVYKIPEINSNNSDISFAEWNIEKIEAPQAWDLPGGNNGEGVVVGTIDTGGRASHEALRNNLRPEYNWFDPYTYTSSPIDESGHGSMILGIMVGAGGIGVSPGSQWVSCRGCELVTCNEATLAACGQFMACPTTPDGNNQDCSKAPNLVSNSWGGSDDGNFFDNAIEIWRAFDIIPLFGVGNSGPACGAVGYPGSHAKVMGIAATNHDDMISSGSRGPGRNNRIKPDFCAPGTNIRSAWATSDIAYNTISGTSMATPHVSGTVALLLSQNPAFNYDDVFALIGDNAERNVPPISDCDDTGHWPNNIYGHGRVNARKSLEDAINSK